MAIEFSPTIELSDLSGLNGFRINGVAVAEIENKMTQKLPPPRTAPKPPAKGQLPPPLPQRPAP